MLKSAALLHLDVHLKALARDFTLSDASAYNIQFRGARPVFIDHLSFRPYVDGEIWAGHLQFCEQFINPLVLAAKAGVMPNAWYRGTQEGLPTADISRLIPLRHKFSWSVFMHIFLQARLDRTAVSGSGDVDTGAMSKARLPKSSLVNMLKGLRSWIAGLQPPSGATVWQNYAGDNSYASSEASEKVRLVGEMVAEVKPGLLLDLGCNSGDYSFAALEAGAGQVVGFDVDFGALEAAFARSQARDLKFFPLYFDAANPSPDQGWAQGERIGFAARAKGDALLALAFIHHLAIGKNIPLLRLLNWLMDRAPEGIIEFVPKEDPMVQRLLVLREDIFDSYSFETFITVIGSRADIVSDVQISESGRRLVRYSRRLGAD
ncbi:MAG: class I SAM-dependent methyltransferase [Alphaproteobacteria bacterium]|nr:class I SAM-dependent methyltransferase [Alphaproteobacteria bacterium]MBT4083652.1 class I SAM-dependent methyltransferase [Alphaproteobacteria bacterium]MBT4545174.1 class I SAM-dependent methyltransferase [Alphaproteobacteria bacterium]MBT7746569.1 class I SAM-dependent methyltransferase [Alphaproteobacteria bacterium]